MSEVDEQAHKWSKRANSAGKRCGVSERTKWSERFQQTNVASSPVKTQLSCVEKGPLDMFLVKMKNAFVPIVIEHITHNL